MAPSPGVSDFHFGAPAAFFSLRDKHLENAVRHLLGQLWTKTQVIDFIDIFTTKRVWSAPKCTESPRTPEINAITRHVDPRFSSALSRQTSPVPDYGQAMRRVLVADDNAVNQMVARGLLELLGCEVEIAADGQQAIDCCRARPPHLVLMDVHMPVLTGLQATQQLRALQRQGALPPFPIVAAMAMHTAQGHAACLAAGMDGYLDKPLDLQALNDEMHRVLPLQPLLQDGNPAQ